MSHDSTTPSFLRSKLFWAVAAVPLAVLVALGGLWYAGYSSLEAQLASLREQGLPTTASEVNDFYVVPDGVDDTTDLWVAAIDAVHAADLFNGGKTLPIIGEGPTPVPPPGEAWAELEAARTLLDELGHEFSAIERAAAAGGQARYPADFSAGIYTLLPYTQNARDVARLLALSAHVSAHDGDNSQALEDIKAIFALSDSLRGEPSLITQLVRIAIHSIGCNAVERLLPYCEWSDAEIESLQVSIRSARFKEEMSHALCGERASSLSAIDGYRIGPFRASNKQELLRFYASAIEGLSKSWPEALSRQREVDARIKSLAADKVNRISMKGVLMLLAPAGQHVTIAGARGEARQKCANAALAAARFRLRHGRLPESLAEIEQTLLGPPTEPAAQLVDPFDGQPLRYKVEETRVLIYCIGEDGQDDGGAIDQNDQGRLLDVGFALTK